MAYTNDSNIKRMLYYHMQIFLFLVRAACELRSTSYVQKRVGVAFPYAILYVIIHTINSKTKGGIRTFNLSNICSTIKDIYSLNLLKQYARYARRVMNPNVKRNYFSIQHFVHTYTLVTRKLYRSYAYVLLIQ